MYIELAERAEAALTELISMRAPHLDLVISARAKINTLILEYEEEAENTELEDDKED